MQYKQALEYAKDMRRNPTEAEAYFWKRVRNKQFFGYKFYRQYVIEGNGKGTFFIADFCCFSSKLIVELDGPIHKLQVKQDEMRTSELVELGFTVIRFSNEEVRLDWNNVAQRLKEFLS